MHASRQAGLTLTVAATVALLASACSGRFPGASAAGSADPSPVETTAASPAAIESPECYGIDESVDTPPDTVASVMSVTDLVVVADVIAIEGGNWNTVDGKAPPQRRGPHFNPGIVTPINIQVDQTLYGEGQNGALRVVNPGGTAGCFEHQVSNAARLEKGKRYAFFLQPSSDADGNLHRELPLIVAAWPVDDAGSVATPENGTLTVSQLDEAIGGT